MNLNACKAKPARQRKMTKRTKVLAFGTFDFIHPGHLAYLKWAKRQGGRGAGLTVIIARDVNVRKIKGRPPFFGEKERLQVISSLAIVDRACLGLSGDRYRVLLREKPDVVCLGYDQRDAETAIRHFLLKHGLHAKVVRAKGKKTSRFKSSLVRAHYRL